jgi:hypothetical protein
MKIYLLIPFISILLSSPLLSQEEIVNEKFGKTINLGIGVGYYGYVGQSVPFGTMNFEFDIARNITLAPFVGIYGYQRSYYWGNKDNPERYYSYKTIVVPVGAKGTYYFDQLLHANPKWDFYAAASAGFAFRQSVWESGYYGNTSIVQSASPLYIGAHIGAEYHMNQKAGLFLDLSTGVSTFGFAIHF